MPNKNFQKFADIRGRKYSGSNLSGVDCTFDLDSVNLELTAVDSLQKRKTLTSNKNKFQSIPHLNRYALSSVEPNNLY